MKTDEPIAFVTGIKQFDPKMADTVLKVGTPLYTHPVKEQDESFDRTASHMAGEYVSWTSCVACGQRVTGDSIHTCSPQLKQLTDEEIHNLMDEIEILVHGDIKRAMYRMARKVESILNE